MNLAEVRAIAEDLNAALTGRFFGRVFVLSRYELAIDIRPDEHRFLYINSEPARPRAYLTRKRLRDIEKTALPPTAFAQLLKKHLSGKSFESVAAIKGDRILAFRLRGADDLGGVAERSLIAQLTGRSANVYLTDGDDVIIGSMSAKGEMSDGERYEAPQRSAPAPIAPVATADHEGFGDLSEALEARDLIHAEEAELRAAAAAARSRAKAEVAKLEKLHRAVMGDIESHGDAERWKRFGDLLLAGVSNFQRNDKGFLVNDLFEPGEPLVQIEADENESATTAAARYFKRYTKARNARSQLSERLAGIERDLSKARSALERVEQAIAAGGLAALKGSVGTRSSSPARAREKKASRSPAAAVARVFTSSEGYEILVGKRSKDNDALTFKIAKSLDTWMHAADYPGSHVVIRNRDRKPIPPATLVEAAQLAAFYSKGKTQPKAAVHYTEKKFVNKPKGAAPGLVSLSSFKTLLVEPKVPEGVTLQQP